MGAREHAKTARRQAILDAARALMAEARDFSMPDLAAKAGVSLVTPYNLFGSKSTILLEIARADIFARAAEIAALATDDLPRWVAETAQSLARVYYANRHFYRRLIITLVAQESAAAMGEMLEHNYRMFEAPITRLQAAGKLLEAVPAATLARHLAHGVSGALQHCLMERGSEAKLRRELESALALGLAGCAGAEDRARLLARLDPAAP